MAFLPTPIDNGEYSVEMNPDSVSADVLCLLHDHGVNRCSFGVQTFSDSGLKLLGRRHSAAQAKKAVTQAVKMNFTSVSLDLISAWPGQSLADLKNDLDTALALGVRHLSCYNLILDEKSAFPARLQELGLSEKSDDEARRFWDTTVEILDKAGFEHYEISNFSLPGYGCRHNIRGWKGYEYHGIGAAAHSCIAGARFANISAVTEYVQSMEKGESPVIFSEELEPEERARECAVFWLRLAEGIGEKEFQARTGFDFRNLFSPKIKSMLSAGYLEKKTDCAGESHIKVADEYYPLLDAVLVELLS